VEVAHREADATVALEAAGGCEHLDAGRFEGIFGREEEYAVVLPTIIWAVRWPALRRVHEALRA
jgi:hypothetical protein